MQRPYEVVMTVNKTRSVIVDATTPEEAEDLAYDILVSEENIDTAGGDTAEVLDTYPVDMGAMGEVSREPRRPYDDDTFEMS